MTIFRLADFAVLYVLKNLATFYLVHVLKARDNLGKEVRNRPVHGTRSLQGNFVNGGLPVGNWRGASAYNDCGFASVDNWILEDEINRKELSDERMDFVFGWFTPKSEELLSSHGKFGNQ